MGFHWGREAIVDTLPPEVYANMKHAYTDPDLVLTDEQETAIPLLNFGTGEAIVDVATSSSRRVSRKKLKDVLTAGIGVQYCKRLVGLEHTANAVELRFEDGSSASGDVVIGADGSRSAVRGLISRPEHNTLETLPVFAVV